MAPLAKNRPVMWHPCVTPELGRSPGEGKGCPLQYSGLENSSDWNSSTVYGVAKMSDLKVELVAILLKVPSNNKDFK